MKAGKMNQMNGAVAEKREELQILLPKLDIMFLELHIVGDTDLITHKWSEKAKKEIRDKQQKVAKQAKQKRDVKQEYLDSLYEHPDGGYGLPAVCFKSSAVDACSHIDGITKVEARGSFHVQGELVKIEFKKLYMREDMVRIGMGVADLRYRGAFKDWKCTLNIRYNARVIQPAQIANLFNTAGFAMGVGEWRPQKNGSYGMYHVGNQIQ